MLNFFNAMFGGIFYSLCPNLSGFLYLRGSLKKNGFSPDRMPPEFYKDLAKYAYDFARIMTQMSSKEKMSTNYVEHLDYLVTLIEKSFLKQKVEAAEPILRIFTTYGLQAYAPYPA